MKKKKEGGGEDNKTGCVCVRGFVTSAKLSVDEGTVASLISLATFLPAGRQGPLPPSSLSRARRVGENLFYFIFSLVLLVGPFHLCPSLQVVVLASNWAVVDMLMRRLGCG